MKIATPIEAGVTPLRTEEKKRLAEVEATIETARVAINAQYRIIGETLMEIRDKLLYRESHPDFETYVKQRWDIGHSRAYQLIAAASVAENVHNIVEIPNESVARQLAPLPRITQIEVAKVLKKATKITAQVAKEIVAKLPQREQRGGWAAEVKAAAIAKNATTQPEIDLNLKPKMSPVAKAQAAATVSEWWAANRKHVLGYPAVPTEQVVQQIVALFT